MKKKHIYVILFCLYIGVVALLCFVRGEQLPELPLQWLGIPADKIVHLLMFMPFTILAFAAVNPSGNSFRGKMLTISAAFCIGAAAAFSTEAIQNRLGYRSYETGDLIMDITGLVVGTVICVLAVNIGRRRER